MRAGSRYAWLGLTPEPERELPAAVATLRARQAGVRSPEALGSWIDAECRRIDALILHGTQRTWLRYLNEVTALVDATAGGPDAATALDAAETVLEHHRMLIGLPGSGYERVEGERETLARIIRDLRERAA